MERQLIVFTNFSSRDVFPSNGGVLGWQTTLLGENKFEFLFPQRDDENSCHELNGERELKRGDDTCTYGEHGFEITPLGHSFVEQLPPDLEVPEDGLELQFHAHAFGRGLLLRFFDPHSVHGLLLGASWNCEHSGLFHVGAPVDARPRARNEVAERPQSTGQSQNGAPDYSFQNSIEPIGVLVDGESTDVRSSKTRACVAQISSLRFAVQRIRSSIGLYHFYDE